MIPKAQRRHAQSIWVGIEIILANAAVQDLRLLVDFEDRGLVQFLENVTEAKHHDLVTDDQHAAVAIM